MTEEHAPNCADHGGYACTCGASNRSVIRRLEANVTQLMRERKAYKAVAEAALAYVRECKRLAALNWPHHEQEPESEEYKAMIEALCQIGLATPSQTP
jgi:hypothetical protein